MSAMDQPSGRAETLSWRQAGSRSEELVLCVATNRILCLHSFFYSISHLGCPLSVHYTGDRHTNMYSVGKKSYSLHRIGLQAVSELKLRNTQN